MTPRRWTAIAIAVALAAALLAVTGQLGAGHAPHPYYRAQVDAFLDGRLALSPSPDALAHDLAWTEHGVQQVWGLGVPAWQTPFELLGRAVGWTPFPDRIALLAWLALALYIALRGFGTTWIGRGSVLVVAALPAFVTLLRGRLGVYEEAAVYSYAAAVMLAGGLAWYARERRPRAYLLLVALAGLTGFLRPTVWFYGLATCVIATALLLAPRPDLRRLRVAALGIALFVAGGAALYATNARRFGDGMEFGHRLNVHSLPGNIVATRFSYPFEDESLIDAATELAGSLFDRPELASDRRGGFYQMGLHLGQQGTPRWREYYFTTYRWAYLPLLLGGILAAALAWRRRQTATDAAATARWLGPWAAVAAVPLLAFYLWSPSLSSRYQLDLGPAFAGLLVIAWQALATRARRPDFAFAALVLVWLAAIVTSKPSRTRAPHTVDSDTAAMMARRITAPLAFERALPSSYDLANAPIHTDVLPTFERCQSAVGEPLPCDVAPSIGDLHVQGVRDELGWLVIESVVESVVEPSDASLACPVEAEPGTCGGSSIAARATVSSVRHEPRPLYLNGVGWDLDTGRVPPATHFYVESPQFLELDITYAPSTANVSHLISANYLQPPVDWPTTVRAAIGLEHLRFVAGQSTADGGVRLRFEPSRPLRPGLHVAFVAFGPDRFLDRTESDFLLRSIRWR